MKATFALVLFLALLLISCRSRNKSVVDTVPTLPDTVPTASYATFYPEVVDMTKPVANDPNASLMVSLAKEHLSRKLNIAVKDIFLSEIHLVQWPDAGLGCPVKDVAYAKVIIDGYLILLEAQGRAFTYHTDMESKVILCDARGPNEIFLPP